MVVDIPGDDFYGMLGNTGFHEILRGIAGPTPTLILSSEEVETITSTLKLGTPEKQRRACQILGSAAEQLCSHALNGHAPAYLDVLTATLVDTRKEVQVRVATVDALAKFGAALEQRGNTLLQWSVSRILDMVELCEGANPNLRPELLQRLREARGEFTYLAQTPPNLDKQS